MLDPRPISSPANRQFNPPILHAAKLPASCLEKIKAASSKHPPRPCKSPLDLPAKCRIAPRFPTPAKMAVRADEYRERPRAMRRFESAIHILIHRHRVELRCV